LCCLADGSKTFHPSSVSKFQKPHCLSRWQEIIQECIHNWMIIIYTAAGLFERKIGLPKQKCTFPIGSMVCSEQQWSYSEACNACCIYLPTPPATCKYVTPGWVTTWNKQTEGVLCIFITRNWQKRFWSRCEKTEHLRDTKHCVTVAG